MGLLIHIIVLPYAWRHLFMEDLSDLREQERSRNEAKRLEVLERRRRQIDEHAGKSAGDRWDDWMDACRKPTLKKTWDIFAYKDLSSVKKLFLDCSVIFCNGTEVAWKVKSDIASNDLNWLPWSYLAVTAGFARGLYITQM